MCLKTGTSSSALNGSIDGPKMLSIQKKTKNRQYINRAVEHVPNRGEVRRILRSSRESSIHGH